MNEYDEIEQYIMEQYNDMELQFELIDEALAEPTKAKKISKLKEVLKEHPYFSDAQMALTSLTAKDIYDTLRDVENTLQLQGEYLMSIDVDFEEEMGHFYSIIETRPFMRLMYHKLQILIELEYYMEAINCCNYMLQLNQRDNMGVRYDLISLVGVLVNFDEAVSIAKQHDDSDLQIQFILLVSALVHNKQAQAKKYAKNLKVYQHEILGAIHAFLEQEDMPEMFSYGSIEHFHTALFKIRFALPLFDIVDLFLLFDEAIN